MGITAAEISDKTPQEFKRGNGFYYFGWGGVGRTHRNAFEQNLTL